MQPEPGPPSEVPAETPPSAELLGPRPSVYTSPHLYPKLAQQKATFNVQAENENEQNFDYPINQKGDKDALIIHDTKTED